MQVLSAQKREVIGKGLATLRAQGFLPAVVYGMGKDSRALSVPASDFLKVWKSAGESTMVGLKIEGEGAKNVVIHDVALDPVGSRPLHVDFYEVDACKALTMRVQIEFTGEPEAVKALGGILVRVMHEVEVEALPKDLPHTLPVDVSRLAAFGDKILLGDIHAPVGVRIIGEPDAVVAKIDAPRAQEEAPAPEVSLESIEVAKKGKKEPALEESEPDEKSS